MPPSGNIPDPTLMTFSDFHRELTPREKFDLRVKAYNRDVEPSWTKVKIRRRRARGGPIIEDSVAVTPRRYTLRGHAIQTRKGYPWNPRHR